MQIELSLTDAEQKAILHYHETVEELVQTMVKNKAYTYMEQIAKENRNMDLEAVVNALPIKTKIEIKAEIEAEKIVEPIEEEFEEPIIKK